jgi:ABC-type uncharacterized transport system substrate-binding protein
MRLIGLVLALVLVLATLAVEAQPGKVYRIGHLSSLSPSGGQRLIDAFKQGLRDVGYVEGQNVFIEHRWADGDYDRLPILAKELVSLNPDLIVSSGGPPDGKGCQGGDYDRAHRLRERESRGRGNRIELGPAGGKPDRT